MAQPVIELVWKESKPYNEITKSNYPGFYCITTEYKGEPSKLLYIGKSDDGNIKTRLSSHKRQWLDKYHGVRVSFAPLSYDSFEKLNKEDILCIENALIYKYDPIENTTNRYKLKENFVDHCFIIKNSGHLPIKFESKLSMEDLYKSYRPGEKQKTNKIPRKSSKNDDESYGWGSYF